MNRRRAVTLAAALLTAGLLGAAPTPTASASPSCGPGETLMKNSRTGFTWCAVLQCPPGKVLQGLLCVPTGTAPSAPSTKSPQSSGGVAA